MIREEEPPLPSTKLGPTLLPSLATNRGLEPRQLLRQVRGDLDWIVMKALAKEPDRRYQSAHELALDLRRFLADEPVQAGPPSRGYRLRKFIRRNKPMVIAATLILLVLLAGVAGTTWGWLNAQKAWAAEAVRAGQEKQAKEQAQLANATAQDRLAQLRQFTRILARIFADANPRTAEKEGKPLYELFAAKLHEATSLLNAQTLNDPVTAAELQTWLASAHSGLGYPDRALPLLEKAHATFRDRQGPNHQNTLRAQASLAEVLLALGKEASGLPLLEQSVQQLQATLGPDDPDSLAALGNLAIAYRRAGRLDAALRLQEEVLRRRQATAGSLHADTLNAMQNLAVAYRVAGKADRAVAMLQETWKLRKETLGENHPDTLRTAVNLGQTYGSLGKPELALPLLRDALSALTTKLGREHPDTLGCIGNLGLVYRQLQKPDLALPLFQEHHRLSQARQGPEHPSTLNSMNNLALGYQAAGQTADALPLFQEVLRLRRAKLPADHPDVLSAMNNVAAIFFDVGRRAEAITLYEEGLQLCKRKLGQEHPNTLLFMTNLADCYEKEGQHARALPLLKEAAEGVEKLGFNHPHAGAILTGYLAALERAGQVEEALRWWPKWMQLVKERRGESLVTARLWTEWCLFLQRHHRYAEAEDQLRGCLALRRKLQPDHWLTYAAQGRLGTVLLARKKHDQAEPLLLEACRAIRERAPAVTPEDRHQYAAALASLIQLYRETGRPADAELWRRELLFQMPLPPAR